MNKKVNESLDVDFAIRAYEELKKNHKEGNWSASPVEESNLDFREFCIRKKGFLQKFRRTYLVSGRQNFPDSPRGGFYFQWGLPGAVPLQLRLQGKLVIYKMVLKLFLYRRFNLNLASLEDSLVGKPVPQKILGRNITESQIRNFYYKEEIKNYLGERHDRIVEIGGGFGGLAGEIVSNMQVKQYLLVDLFDALPLAYYYLKNRLETDTEIQLLTSESSEIDPNAAVVLLPPSLMHKITNKTSLFINTMSFQHMTAASIGFYLEEASRLDSEYIFLNNRDWVRDPTDVIISEYPIPNNYKTIIWKKWLYGDHNLAIYKRN